MGTDEPGHDRAEALWRRVLGWTERTLQDALDDIHAALCELNWTPETVSAVPAGARPLAVTLPDGVRRDRR